MKYFIALLLLMLPAFAQAHGVEAVSMDTQAVTVQINYSTGEPMAYAEVKVFSPLSPGTETLFGYADRNGRYAFIPDEDGEWRIEAVDGMGHKTSYTVSYFADSAADISTEGGKAPLYIRALLGVSLILNIFALYAFFRRGKNAH